jgi:heme-degrading monooxygenase HmoA
VADTYTHSLWTVKPGQEDEFVRRWLELAELGEQMGLSGPARLLRDRDNPHVFVSFGPWQSLEKVARWRSSAEFHHRISRLQEVLDGFEPRTLEQVTES